MTEENTNPYAGKKLKRPVEEVRAQLLADDDVKEQARLLQLPVEKYVEKILDYATNPEKPLQLQITPDEELKKQNPNIPTVEEIHTYLEKVVKGEEVLSPAHMPDGYSEDRSRAKYQSALASNEVPKGPPSMKDSGSK